MPRGCSRPESRPRHRVHDVLGRQGLTRDVGDAERRGDGGSVLSRLEVRSSRMRSLTSKPAALRVSCTARMTSRARPSASSSGVPVVSSSTKPPLGSSGERFALGPTGRSRGRGRTPPARARSPPAVTTPSVSRPVPRARGLDRLLHLLAESRTGSAGVDGESVRDAVRVRGVALQIDELDGS